MKRKLQLFAALLLFGMAAQAQLNGSGYYRLQNKTNTNHYVSMANDHFSHTFLFGTSQTIYGQTKKQGVAGGLSNLADHTDAVKADLIAAAQMFMQNDIKLVDDPDCTNPSTIIYLKKKNTSSSDYNYNIIAQGTSLLTLTAGKYEASVRLLFQDIYTKLQGSAARGYTASVDIAAYDVENISYNSILFAIGKSTFLSQAKLATQYFSDNNGTFTFASSAGTNGTWNIIPVTSINVVPTAEFNGKWYTTYYVPFAFTLGGNVENAYAITGQDGGILTKTSIASTGGTVPAGTPVILECSSNEGCTIAPTGEPLFTPQTNQATVAPAASTATNYSGTNYLKGTYFDNEDPTYTYTYNRQGTDSQGTIDLSQKTAYNANTMRVLGVSPTTGQLGFFKAATGTNMKANKAWLDISTIGTNVKSYAINFGDETGIEAVAEEDEDDIMDGNIYDLSGRQIANGNLSRGMYIINGKKVMIQ